MKTDKDHEDLVKGVADQGLEGDRDSSASQHQNENHSDFLNLKTVKLHIFYQQESVPSDKTVNIFLWNFWF